MVLHGPNSLVVIVRRTADIFRQLIVQLTLDETDSFFKMKTLHNYRIVASRSTSRLVTCLGLFRLLMKGIFGPYVLWPLDKKLIFWIVTRISACDYTVCPKITISTDKNTFSIAILIKLTLDNIFIKWNKKLKQILKHLYLHYWRAPSGTRGVKRCASIH